MNKAGGSAAFGRWASTHIHTRAGAQFATLLLGILIFVDDYFNCLTVGSVMRPVTDRQKVSRAKLAYLIDATAAPICIIAPVSSWAAAVTSSVPEGSGINGFTMFLRTIPYNYYAILTMVMSLFLIFSGLDYGPMKKHEDNALLGDLFTTDDRPYGDDVDDGSDTRGHVVDSSRRCWCSSRLHLRHGVHRRLLRGCGLHHRLRRLQRLCGPRDGQRHRPDVHLRVLPGAGRHDLSGLRRLHPRGLQGHGQPHAHPDAGMDPFRHDRPAGRKVLRRKPAQRLCGGSAVPAAHHHLCGGGLPRLCHRHVLGHLLDSGPIVCHAFPDGEMLVVSIAACLSGAVCGDHCSPISDTTIMASVGAHCSHVNHVSTQLPYAMTAAAISAGCYLLCGAAQAVLGDAANTLTSFVLLACAIVIELVVLSIVRARMGHTGKEEVTKS